MNRRRFLARLAAAVVAPFVVPTVARAGYRAVDHETGIAIRFVREYDSWKDLRTDRVYFSELQDPTVWSVDDVRAREDLRLPVFAR